MSEEKILEKGLISVVMSNYNTPLNYLKESIDSVLNQTYSNFEFIIIDDGSTDDSLEFIKSYDDPRIKLIINEENIGLTKSLNKGLDLARGEYIARMDADDICYPERLEKQIEYMDEHPDTIVCGTWAEIIDEDGTAKIEKWACGRINDMDIYRINLLFCNFPCVLHPSTLINHKLLLRNNIVYNENIFYAQDYEMWTNCSKVGDFFILPLFLLKYRIHNKSITQSKRNLQKEYDFQIIQALLDDLHLKFNYSFAQQHLIFLTNHIYYFSGNLYNKDFKKWLKEIIKANRKHKKYNHKKLKKLIWYHWSRICYLELSRSKPIKIIAIITSLSPRCIINIFKIKKNYINKYK